jgi:hypothetical protein
MVGSRAAAGNELVPHAPDSADMVAGVERGQAMTPRKKTTDAPASVGQPNHLLCSIRTWRTSTGRR